MKQITNTEVYLFLLFANMMCYLYIYISIIQIRRRNVQMLIHIFLFICILSFREEKIGVYY